MRNGILGVAAAATAFIMTAAAPSAQQAAPGDWPHFNRDSGSTRYVPLDQINATNVARLQPAWTFTTVVEPPPGAGPGPAGRAGGAGRGRGGPSGVGAQVVPVVVEGVMYVPAGNVVVALNAATGKEVWRYTVTTGAASNRGVNYWPGTRGVGPRIVFTTRGQSSNSLVALDADTGKPSAGFGQNGITDLGSVGWSGVPVVFRNVLALGASTLETPQDANTPGDTRGFDAVTGKLKWTFHSVPRPGEVGHDTWLNDGWKDRSGTNIWNHHMTADEQLGLLYLPISGPASNYYGGDRPGDNLFGNSIVAIDGDTGAYKWHFQLVHHDIWDFDNPPAPALLDITQNGQRIPVLAQIGKSGWMFILDRRNGKPVFGVDERPVAKGDVPGEWYAPTQPFPRKPRALARMSFTYEDLVTAEDTTPAHAANCRALLEKSGGVYNVGPFTPFLYHEEGTPPRTSLIFPGATGGTNWGGMATDQQRGYVFVYTQNQGQIGWVEKKKPRV